MNMSEIVSKLGGKKTLLTVLVLVITTIVLVLGSIDDQAFLDILQAVLVAYPVSNAVQKTVVTKTPVEPGPPSRKFWLAIGVYILISVLLAFGTVDALIYVTATQYVITTYLLGNVGAKILGQIKK